MQAQEEFEGSNIDHQALIMKGKRTKRQRSSSPFGLTVTSSSSSACGGDNDGSGGGGVTEEYNSISSISGEIYESTEEEEDMANCLIMLAQSDGPKRRHDIGKKFEMVASTKKADLSAYECKTCNRSFQSFQALGGHRASHKKSKGAMADEKKQHVSADADQFNSENPTVVALQVNNNNNNNKKGNISHGNKDNKMHECSICGSEFSSGQALGGHMRRHRASNIQAPIESRNGDGIKRTSTVLLFDLNLPAPEDDPRDSKFQFGAPQQAIVFSTPALVDCHY